MARNNDSFGVTGAAQDIYFYIDLIKLWQARHETLKSETTVLFNLFVIAAL
jgi:hypothetical protein